MSQQLHASVLGSGKPLVILHGFLGMSDNWKTLGNQYAENGFQVHLVDQRNHGRSFHSEAFNYDILAKDIKDYLEQNNIEKASILGHSMGGKTAMQFACDYPELTEKLIVADIAPKYYPPHHQYILNGLSSLDLSQIQSRTQADKELSNHISEVGIRQFLLKNLYWIKKGSLAFRFNLPVLKEKMEEIGENISTTASFEGPTLFLKGDASEYISSNDIEVIHCHFPKAQIETIDKAGHWLHAENPKQFFEKSLKFMNS